MWVEVRNGQVYQMFDAPHGFRDKNGILHDRSIFTRWSAEELRTVGIYPVVVQGEPPTMFHREIPSAEYTIEEEQVVLTKQFEAVDLDRCKDAARGAVNLWKIERQDSEFEFQGHMFQCNDRARGFITGIALEAAVAKLLEQEYSVTFTDADNQDHNFDADEAIALGQVAAEHVKFWHEEAKLIKAQIDSAADVETVDTILRSIDVTVEK